MTDSGFFPRLWNALLVLAFLLASLMAFWSPAFVHPDEKASIGAVDYYLSHWKPADIRAPDAAASFSGYGVSRLDQRTVYYFLAGKIARLASSGFSAKVPERFFNLLLFALLICLCIRRGRSSPELYLMLGLSPQIWYLFSYCTSDAWDYFLCIILLHESVHPESLLQRTLREPRFGHALPGLLAIGSLLGLLALGKATAWAGILVVAIHEAYQLWRTPPRARKTRFQRNLLLVLAASLWLGGGLLSERLLYGGRHHEIRREMHVKMRQNAFIPDNLGDVAYSSVNIRHRGVSLPEMLFSRKYDFLLTSYASFTGCYGPLNHPSPHLHYLLMGLGYVLLGSGWLARFFHAKPRPPDFLYACALLSVPLLLFGASIAHSWTQDMQPQGRYLFPSNSTYGALSSHPTSAQARHLPLSYLVLTLLFLLGLASFFFSALMPLAQPPFRPQATDPCPERMACPPPAHLIR